jgi:hypothetical protein
MSFLTFIVGWNHYVQNGFETFNVGFMAMTPLTAFILTSVWLKTRPEDDSENP